MQTIYHRIVIVGGGCAGISVAARMCRALKNPDVAVIEPSETHYYQPLWTLVGGGVFPKEHSARLTSSLIPRGVTWLKDAVTEFHPQENFLLTQSGKKIGYDYLVVAAGLQIDWGKIKGLKENLGTQGICSNYSYQHVDKTWEFLRGFQGGTAIFTMPPPPIKCAGAPQKIMYLAEDYLRKHGVRGKSRVIFASATPGIFAVAKYAAALNGIVARRGIETLFRQNLIELRTHSKEAVFQNLDNGATTVVPYQMIHVTPPMSAPDFIKKSPLANGAGWVEVDKYTMRHPRYPNVFSLGDASSLPTSKTAAAVRQEAPILVKNLLAAMHNEPLTGRYDGYTSCPLVTGYGKLILAEFDYDLNPKETFPFDQSKERLSMYLLKKYVLPALYWHGMLRGRF
ncbi:MAG: NAD(P)/FAD-dependent oxidoreductase [Gammaproteobacteria bacterium]|nr:NAD(P)/FAD-dependent oxidoreductase [Gammaproteobacteria bacterium]